MNRTEKSLSILMKSGVKNSSGSCDLNPAKTKKLSQLFFIASVKVFWSDKSQHCSTKAPEHEKHLICTE